MSDAEMDRQRKILQEAFLAGWQAALAVRVTSPGALAVVESCFDLWLEEEVDERGVLGLPFRRRYDLPRPRRRLATGGVSRPSAPARHVRRPSREANHPAEAMPPPQRTSPEAESYDGPARDTRQVRTGS